MSKIYKALAFGAVSFVLMPFLALAQDNAELIELFRIDQAARQVEEIDWEVLSKEDEVRRDTVLTILESGGIKTAKDFYNAALIFQHGESPRDIRLSHAFATISSTLDGESSKAANSLKAASWDRLMYQLDQPQWYGTQYVRGNEGEWVLYPVLTDAVTDEQREEWSVPPLKESKDRLELMNNR